MENDFNISKYFLDYLLQSYELLWKTNGVGWYLNW